MMKILKFTTASLFAAAMMLSTASAATIAYWNTATSGGTLTDLTGNGYDLSGNRAQSSGVTIAPNPLPNPDTVGDDSGSIYFGSGTTAPNRADGSPFKLLSNSSFTFEGWVNGNGFTGVIGGDRGTSAFEGWYLHRIGSTLTFDVLDVGTSGEDATVSATTNVADGSSHHFAAVWDHNNDQIRLYIDGTLEDTATLSASIIDNNYSQKGFAIGGRANNGDGVYNDNLLTTDTRLDELRFSDQALAASQFLNAIPEPSSLSLLALGALGLSVLRRRQG